MGLIIEMVENHIDEVLAELKQAKKQALEAVGLQAEGYAQMYAPVDTGRLRNSISHKVIDNNSVAIGTNVEYAPYQELGTSRMSAQPFLKPACENHMDEYQAIVKKALKDVHL